MNKNYYAPIRHRKDGSVYIGKDHPMIEILTATLFAVAAPLAFAVILIIAISG